MRIAYLSTFYPFRGGIAQFNADLLNALAKDNEVKAFTFTRQYPDFLFPGKTQYVTETDKAEPVDSTAVLDTANPFDYRRAARKIAAWNPDVVVMKYWMSYLAPSLGSVAGILRKKGVKTIAILDNVIPHEGRFFDKPFSKWFLRRCSGCIAMSSTVRDDMLSLTPDKPHILREHPLYDHFGARMDKAETRAALKLDADAKVLLFFGLIRDYKGLDLLIDAMKGLGDDYRLVIAGESYGDATKYETQIGGDPRITLMNRYIGDEEVPALFSAADVCVLPYRSATQSGITAISVHFGLPLVATPVGGLPLTVGGTGIGKMTSEVSSASVREAIEAFFAEDRSKYGEAMEALRREATWPNFAKALTDFALTLK